MDTLSYKTISATPQNVQKDWVVIDAENAVLGRLTSQVAALLRGKHKTSFTPHVDCGDHVIVINAGKVRLTGNKLNDKLYVRHTGHPGGQRFATPREWLSRVPGRVIEHAVKGMLPKNRLGRRIFTNLHVYAGSEHPHAAQQPKTIELSN